MGKLTRAPVRFVMALANLRLGVWVANPRHLVKGGSWQPEPRDAAEAGADSAKPPPDFLKRPRLSYLFREMLGRNRVDARFLYVTDGGHYENLGLVELLRRGCDTVYCFDASGGKPFAALGDALARSELEVEIEKTPRRCSRATEQAWRPRAADGG